MAEVAEQRKVSYVRMDEGTVEDYALQSALAKPFMAATPERLLAFMESLHHTFPGGRIDRYAHCLQTATRAEDAGECEEIVVAGLLHDIGDSLAPHNHGIIGAEILRPFVARHTYWMLRHHDVFQGYYFWDKVGLDKHARDRHRDHPAYDMTVRFTGRLRPDGVRPRLRDPSPGVLRAHGQAYLRPPGVGRAHAGGLAGRGLRPVSSQSRSLRPPYPNRRGRRARKGVSEASYTRARFRPHRFEAEVRAGAPVRTSPPSANEGAKPEPHPQPRVGRKREPVQGPGRRFGR